jgi:hypothetical protein
MLFLLLTTLVATVFAESCSACGCSNNCPPGVPCSCLASPDCSWCSCSCLPATSKISAKTQQCEDEKSDLKQLLKTLLNPKLPDGVRTKAKCCGFCIFGIPTDDCHCSCSFMGGCCRELFQAQLNSTGHANSVHTNCAVFDRCDTDGFCDGSYAFCNGACTRCVAGGGGACYRQPASGC